MGCAMAGDFPLVPRKLLEDELRRHEAEMKVVERLVEFLLAHLTDSVEEKGFARAKFKKRRRVGGRPKNQGKHLVILAKVYEDHILSGKSPADAYKAAAKEWLDLTGRKVDSFEYVRRLVAKGRGLEGRRGQRVRRRKT